MTGVQTCALPISVYCHSLDHGGAVSYSTDGFEYICKLFTNSDYEGLGIATSIVETVHLHKGKVAWRCSLTNDNLVKYYDKIVNHYKGASKHIGTYKVFMIGFDENDSLDSVAGTVANVPTTFKMIGDTDG